VTTSSPQRCDTPFGEFSLSRLPVDRSGTLRAWDGADLLLLEAVAALNLQSTSRVLVLGDNFGALSLGLSQFHTIEVVDSQVAKRAIARNREMNRVSVSPTMMSSVQPVTADSLGGPVDVVVWNVDREMSVLAHYGALVQRVCHSGSIVFAAGMDKHLPPKTAEVLRVFGNVTTHPGRRKAHLFEVRSVVPLHQPVAHQPVADPPAGVGESVHLVDYDLEVSGGPGVFSSERLDLGTRLLAEQVVGLREILPDCESIVDLGCGTGVLGMLALRALPRAEVLFVDESSHAVAAAQRNVHLNAGSLGPNAVARAHFAQSDVLVDVTISQVDLVLCNPPFHHANALNDETAWQMFLQSHQALRADGELWVVANRHLEYHHKLARLFRDAGQIASHPKFVVLGARR
jgi:23S rRNA (guanine1835-N2)-methyltransferase